MRSLLLKFAVVSLLIQLACQAHGATNRVNSLTALAEILAKTAEPGDIIELEPGTYFMEMERMPVRRSGTPDLPIIVRGILTNGVRPAIDVTLASVAARYKEASVSVVLTGMGRDGTNGSILIHEAGGRVIAEDEETCVVWGMPRSVAEAGVAQVIAKLPDVAREVEKAVKNEQ